MKKILTSPLIRFVVTLTIMSSASAQTVKPLFTKPASQQLTIGGFIGERLKANLEQWELPAPSANPAIIEMFYDRDRQPSRRPLPWHGEFVGKYMSAAVLSYRLLRDPRQKEQLEQLKKQFTASQALDGYLGAFDSTHRLTGNNWDIWNHYWAMRALILYHEEFGDTAAFNTATRAADMLVSKFLHKDFRFTNDGQEGQMNYAVIHAFTQLYLKTKKKSYLNMAEWIVDEWEKPGAGRYISMALNGYDMFEFPADRWESLHDFQGMYDMYLITGDKKYRDAFVHIWYSILKGDRHNTGGFTTGEKTTGNPYAHGAIETCCTVAWIDMSIDMLKLIGDPLVADELELATYNGLAGAQTPSGRWWTYSTPMDGAKLASAHEINFQCRPGSPELNCCSVNGPRGLALVSEWAILSNDKGPVMNYYGSGQFETTTPSGLTLVLKQTTNYPAEGKILLSVESVAKTTSVLIGTAQPADGASGKNSSDGSQSFSLQLRIPSWSQNTMLKVNNAPQSNIKPGTYHAVDRQWKEGDQIELTLDMTPHYWAGEKEAKGKTSMYLGPVLLAFDPAYNDIDAAAIPKMEIGSMSLKLANTEKTIKPLLMVEVASNKGESVRLCDFATAGAYGNQYVSWLPLGGVKPVAFDKKKPVWINRPERK